MPTVRLVPSAYSVSSSNRVTVTDPSNMYYNTDHTANYCSIRGRNSSSSTYYAFINGFNFSSVPSNAQVTSFAIKIRAYKNSYLQQGTSYRPRLASSASNNNVISDTTLNSDVTTTSGGTVYTFPNGSLTWSTLSGYGSNFSIEIPLRSSGNSYPYLYVYGAEIEVTYSAEDVHVTGVDVSPATVSIEEGETTTLTATVSPSNATNKTVTWSTNNSSVATVSDGVVTAVSAGNARITATTQDGSYTDYCDVTVTQPTYTDYVLATTLEAGKEYLIATGNSGSVYLVSTDSAGSGSLQGVAATVSNNKISITGSVAAKTLFSCELEDNSNQNSTILKNGNNYLYTDSSSRLRMATSWTSSMASKHWHYKANNKDLLWFFKDSGDNDGYTDTSSTYKYYLSCSSGVFSDLYVSTTSLENTNTPAIYIFTEAPAAQDKLYIKDNGSWVEASAVYKKVSGSWVLQTDLTNVFDSGTNYKMG